MEITRYYHSNSYNVEDSHGNVICTFHDLKTAVTVKRYINGDSLTEEEINFAVGNIEIYDESENAKAAERQQRRERERQKAAARKAAQEEVGKRLKELRKETPLQEVSAAVHITENSLSDYEAGKRMPRDEIKIALADYYGINVATLFNVSLED